MIKFSAGLAEEKRHILLNLFHAIIALCFFCLAFVDQFVSGRKNISIKSLVSIPVKGNTSDTQVLHSHSKFLFKIFLTVVAFIELHFSFLW